jgi:peptidyl-tRNA hydrolase, PTH1 family
MRVPRTRSDIATLSAMKPHLLLVGLGNPGATHAATRHNAGFWVMDRLSTEFGEGEWKPAQKFLAEVQEGRVVTVPVLLVKPQTYMNRSGEAVRKLLDFYKLSPAQHLLVFSDDIDLAAGIVRFRENGGPGTHNGLKSVVESIGEEFPRIRIGIGPSPSGADLATWVLSAMPRKERANVDAAIETVPMRVREFVMGEQKQSFR